MKTFVKIFLVALVLAFLAVGAFASTTISNIDQRAGWQTCSTCGGKSGSTVAAPHTLTQGVSSPSLDGASANFWLGGSTPYADVIWWNRLGGNDSASHFVYDLNFYVKSPSAAQALEFDVNQTVSGVWYVFGTECNYRQYGQWRVWDTRNAKWILTGIPCQLPKAYSWNHVTLEFQRTNGMAKFISVTFNGVKHYINRSYYPKSGSGSQISVAVQLDGNYLQTDFSLYVDKLALTYW